jgi:hypothetical protein
MSDSLTTALAALNDEMRGDRLGNLHRYLRTLSGICAHLAELNSVLKEMLEDEGLRTVATYEKA